MGDGSCWTSNVKLRWHSGRHQLGSLQALLGSHSSISKKILNKSQSLSIFRPCIDSQRPSNPISIENRDFFLFIRIFHGAKIWTIGISNSMKLLRTFSFRSICVIGMVVDTLCVSKRQFNLLCRRFYIRYLISGISNTLAYTFMAHKWSVALTR